MALYEAPRRESIVCIVDQINCVFVIRVGEKIFGHFVVNGIGPIGVGLARDDSDSCAVDEIDRN